MLGRVHLNYTNIVLLNCRQECLVEETKNDNKNILLEKGIRDHRCLRLEKKKEKYFERWFSFGFVGGSLMFGLGFCWLVCLGFCCCLGWFCFFLLF